MSIRDVVSPRQYKGDAFIGNLCGLLISRKTESVSKAD